MTKTGKDLISLGYKPGKWFSEAIAYINEHQLDNDQIKNFMDTLIPKHINPHSTSAHYHKNIEAETEEEIGNIEAVFRSMDGLMKTPTIINGAIMPDACPTGGTDQIPVGGIAVAKMRFTLVCIALTSVVLS